ncbi:MAG: site-specific integrase, partial [Pedobacter sp.]
DLTKNPGLAKVRDLFCFAAFTGQRYSDVAGLRPEHIKGNTWHLRVQKTTELNRIPLNEFALEILNRYPGQQLPAISNQKTNDYLKIIGGLAGIDEPITLHRYRGSEKIERTEPKSHFIGTHTARRTFATLMLEKGMRPEVVMRIGGWKDYRSFKKYIRLTDKVAEAEMNAISWAKPV